MSLTTPALIVWHELWIVAVPLLVILAVAGVTWVKRHRAPTPKPFIPAQRQAGQR